MRRDRRRRHASALPERHPRFRACFACWLPQSTTFGHTRPCFTHMGWMLATVCRAYGQTWSDVAACAFGGFSNNARARVSFEHFFGHFAVRVKRPIRRCDTAGNVCLCRWCMGRTVQITIIKHARQLVQSHIEKASAKSGCFHRSSGSGGALWHTGNATYSARPWSVIVPESSLPPVLTPEACASENSC